MIKAHKEKVNVVHDQDLEAFLDKIGVLQDYLSGEKKCKFCKIVMTLDNLHSVFPQSGDVKFVCDKPECIRELTGLLREGTVNL
jgi:hypothetical protein